MFAAADARPDALGIILCLFWKNYDKTTADPQSVYQRFCHENHPSGNADINRVSDTENPHGNACGL